MRQIPPENIWNQDAQKSFFSLLKTKAGHEQGEFILAKAEELTKYGNSANHDLLKGAESLMNMYTLKYHNPKDSTKAKELLATIYHKLGETEKANRFLK
ncbi:hypothetical protein Oweho_1789 [Owenweeksia hongkongensis DSM 17368]|uniref:Tetratricopeptide repeat protein n=1 Tax=Owenweeksia hongkongensis (strain DSM 17368 / CIP 108786 / JCM 12287 / NRRL B-23963 / UST20020801) TaxID=926562 RepID=G8R154_OWEHD|nr:hypothetical protein [Owenweeksia hongkongensis]AEV32769.1 hypothetical protein Oweho_1789 [Owenweeksia hongkongensis DSM 17368]